MLGVNSGTEDGCAVQVTLSPTAEVVVKHCVDLLLSTEDFPEKSAINILVKAFSASSPELASSFVHPAATRALALLKDPACDDTSTRNALAVLKSVAALPQDSALPNQRLSHAVDVVHGAVVTAIELIKPSSTTAPNISLGLMALLTQLEPSRPEYRALYSAAGSALARLVLADEAMLQTRLKAIVALHNLSKQVPDMDDQSDRAQAARGMLRHGMGVAVAVVGSESVPEEVRCEGLKLLLSGLEAAPEDQKATLMQYVAPLAVHMLKDSSATAAVAQGVQAITVLAPQPEFKAQLATLPPSMKADLQRALTAGAAKQGGPSGAKKEKKKINFSSFRK